MPEKPIVVFDLCVTNNSPSGQDILGMLGGLYQEYQFTVLSDEFDDPAPGKIEWIRVPLPAKPIFLRFMAFQWLAPRYYQRYLQQNKRPWLILGTEGEYVDCDICWAHFCHAAYLNNQWPSNKSKGLRRVARSINHRFNANREAKAFKQAKVIVVPSKGLGNEVAQTYPAFADKIVEIPNPIEIERFRRPAEFDSRPIRESFGFRDEDIVMVFIALGDFSRKGLDLLLEAISKLSTPQAKLLVVGGSSSEVKEYEQIRDRLGLSKQVAFAGFQKDVRPYLWSADLFVFPSAYETFSRIVFEASAAGLPFIATKVHGVVDVLEDGVNGWLVEREVASITPVLEEALTDKTRLREMGETAKNKVQNYDVTSCVKRWRSLLQELELTHPSK
jgi:glycosyltransferase involved in cell wall biosynthesis